MLLLELLIRRNVASPLSTPWIMFTTSDDPQLQVIIPHVPQLNDGLQRSLDTTEVCNSIMNDMSTGNRIRTQKDSNNTR